MNIKRIKLPWAKFWQGENGSGPLETSLMIGIGIVVLFAGFGFLGSSINESMEGVGKNLDKIRNKEVIESKSKSYSNDRRNMGSKRVKSFQHGR